MSLERAADQATILTGDKEKLKDLLRLRLNECGWIEEVTLLCRQNAREQLREQKRLNVDEMVTSVTPKARQIVPDIVKRELLQKIKSLLEETDQFRL